MSYSIKYLIGSEVFINLILTLGSPYLVTVLNLESCKKPLSSFLSGTCPGLKSLCLPALKTNSSCLIIISAVSLPLIPISTGSINTPLLFGNTWLPSLSLRLGNAFKLFLIPLVK